MLGVPRGLCSFVHCASPTAENSVHEALGTSSLGEGGVAGRTPTLPASLFAEPLTSGTQGTLSGLTLQV